jgi:hypothetical protein
MYRTGTKEMIVEYRLESNELLVAKVEHALLVLFSSYDTLCIKYWINLSAIHSNF